MGWGYADYRLLVKHTPFAILSGGAVNAFISLL